MGKDCIISEHLSSFQIFAVPTGVPKIDKLLPPDKEPRELEKYQLVKEPSILFMRDVVTEAEVLALVHYAAVLVPDFH